jgi:restriction endonuclease
VVETKGTTDIHQLRPDEQIKILSARKRFDIVEEVKFIAPIDNLSNFTQKW